jgi:hypothetical protein
LAARLFTPIRILDLDHQLMTFDEGKPNGGEPQLDGRVGKSEHSATSKNICSELLFSKFAATLPDPLQIPRTSVSQEVESRRPEKTELARCLNRVVDAPTDRRISRHLCENSYSR